jgi:hypothetical protein
MILPIYSRGINVYIRKLNSCEYTEVKETKKQKHVCVHTCKHTHTTKCLQKFRRLVGSVREKNVMPVSSSTAD